ncbi:hypothetical protein AGMMS50249_6260 [candidate division SR1 bacterium]|nr:hypothetical protein AGMMS50249_6260 [candidate division SR1 bacterium]
MSDSDVFSPNVYDPNISNPNIPAPNAPVSNIPDIDTISQHTNTKTDTKNLAKQLKGNIIRFSIGVILLVMCRLFVGDHPAEKISFFSGFKVIYQNIEVAMSNIFGENGTILKQKYALEDYYEVMIAMSEEKPCIEPSIVQDLHDTYNNLVKEPKSTLNHTLEGYIDKQIIFDRELRIDCDVPNEDVSNEDELLE